jgi:hypothetical protein
LDEAATIASGIRPPIAWRLGRSNKKLPIVVAGRNIAARRAGAAASADVIRSASPRRQPLEFDAAGITLLLKTF